ncbi:phosphate ABC transporter permease PstA [Cellvibrio japonicus]|uniref:Phosphate transport system permease protein PstA n=1 Tax=Cellvibrio japonicus (strain Ueda107) TaxID=498211 RepID=B3PBL3_CELJU|nr:phosphate ABC transporter permease PstA [Cellvibrio japonicus]ACE85389.1 phosphate ABC transporter, permease protein [Cellvibrio japonicus Ueda107]QEI13126.1 phosphate ABC transporter permease PstA [Cellvibrio japonicus]QEI16700.1 phosphate ABC transporter permease PstA [Cellvibrio japonicus]QEI20278.1 phosphate ABC transporter permease PstA [Cellvibrio japonicus]
MKNLTRRKTGWFASGAPWIWLNAGAMAASLVMVIGIVGLIAVRGFGHFWPADILETTVVHRDGQQQKIMGEFVREEIIAASVARDGGYQVEDGKELLSRYLIKLGNRDVSGRDFVWFMEMGMGEWTYPSDAIVVERREWGNFYGFPLAIQEGDKTIVEVTGASFWDELDRRVTRALELHAQIHRIEKTDIGRINRAMDELRLERRRLELKGVTRERLVIADAEFAERRAVLEQRYSQVKQDRDEILLLAKRDKLHVRTADGKNITIPLDNIVRVTRPNTMGVFTKAGQYVERFWEFMTDEPREANTEGGIFPAIFGTITMVLVMSIIVSPFGVLAAIYLREYARDGTMLKIIRISVYNLAGVPSIVYGVFGLGFFVYTLGGNIDQLFYPESLPSPTFGTPGLFWASLTLALLTLPIVIVSTEEGLTRIPSSIRQGSLALGATKAETLWKVVVPLATPAMMTGLILAIARAAGEVAPLMLVGVVKLAPSLPIDGNFPYIHLDQKIMHLGFHIYDVGFQSPSVEAARPLVYATALVLVLLIIVLNITAIRIRNNLREKYRSASD